MIPIPERLLEIEMAIQAQLDPLISGEVSASQAESFF